MGRRRCSAGRSARALPYRFQCLVGDVHRPLGNELGFSVWTRAPQPDVDADQTKPVIRTPDPQRRAALPLCGVSRVEQLPGQLRVDPHDAGGNPLCRGVVLRATQTACTQALPATHLARIRFPGVDSTFITRIPADGDPPSPEVGKPQGAKNGSFPEMFTVPVAEGSVTQVGIPVVGHVLFQCQNRIVECGPLTSKDFVPYHLESSEWVIATVARWSDVNGGGARLAIWTDVVTRGQDDAWADQDPGASGDATVPSTRIGPVEEHVERAGPAVGNPKQSRWF